MRGTTIALVFVLALPAAAQPVLVRPHVVGPVGAGEAAAFAAAFAERVSDLGGEPVSRVEIGPCVTPQECVAPGHHEVYWVQLSGDADRRVGVAIRMDGAGEIVDRATGDCAAGEASELGALLGAAVAAGQASGVEISVSRMRGAAAYLDGEPVGRTPVRLRQPIDSGLHVVRVDTWDGRSAVALLDAPADGVARLDLDLSDVPRGKKVGAWPLLPVLLGSATAAILLATDPAGVIGPDYSVTIVTP